MHPMPGNDHDLIMQFARGTEALQLLEVLKNLTRDMELERAQVDQEHSRRMNMLNGVYRLHVRDAVNNTLHRIDNLTPVIATTYPEDDDGD